MSCTTELWPGTDSLHPLLTHCGWKQWIWTSVPSMPMAQTRSLGVALFSLLRHDACGTVWHGADCVIERPHHFGCVTQLAEHRRGKWVGGEAISGPSGKEDACQHMVAGTSLGFGIFFHGCQTSVHTLSFRLRRHFPRVPVLVATPFNSTMFSAKLTSKTLDNDDSYQ